MKMKNLLIIALASVVMFGCSGGGGWPKEQMDLCVSQGSIDFGADIATCICSELEKTYALFEQLKEYVKINFIDRPSTFLYKDSI